MILKAIPVLRFIDLGEFVEDDVPYQVSTDMSVITGAYVFLQKLKRKVFQTRKTPSYLFIYIYIYIYIYIALEAVGSNCFLVELSVSNLMQ